MPGLTGALTVAGVLAGCGEAAAPTAEQQARASAAGFDAGLAYVTDVAGYTPAVGGAGAYGDSAFQAIYTSATGNDLRLTVERAALTAQSCAALPIPAAEPAGAAVTCITDGDGWRRSSGNRQEYALTRGDVLIRASGPSTTSAGMLRTAAKKARPATSAELAKLLGPAQGGPIERGDISGDNAPDNSVGAGG